MRSTKRQFYKISRGNIMQNNEEHNINYEYITRYIRRTMKKSEGLILEIEKYAKENDVPIAQPETIRLIENMLLFSDEDS